MCDICLSILFLREATSLYRRTFTQSKGTEHYFLNPYYIELLKDKVSLYEQFDYICSDGMVPIMLNNIWGKSKSVRISFDMTSLAKRVFDYCQKSKQSIFF